MILIDDTGRFILRPHPGRDANGWGSSWYAQPFIAGATLSNTVIENVVAYSDRIYVKASGQVSRGESETYGTWNVAHDLIYDSGAKRVSGTGTYTVTLASELIGGIGDLNLYKIASNYLDEVPLTVIIDGNSPFVWMPPVDSCPLIPAQKLSVDVSGAYNNVDTAAQGYEPIEPAYKPSLSVVLSTTQPASPSMIFCGFYDEATSQSFAADNVGLHAVVRYGII